MMNPPGDDPDDLVQKKLDFESYRQDEFVLLDTAGR